MTTTRNKLLDERNATLNELLEVSFDNLIRASSFMIPGVVDSYDASKKTVEVTPALKRIYLDGTNETMAPISNVPVAFQQAKNFSFTYPIQKGSEGILIFSQRSLEEWKKKGGIVLPEDPRRNHLSDAFFIPGITFPGGGDEGDENNVVLKYFNGKIELTPEGQIKNNGTALTIDC